MAKVKTATRANLGEGDVKKTIVKLALPLVVAQIVNMLYSMVDRIYIGNIEEIGSIAFGGMTVAYPILVIVSAVAALCAYGASPLVGIKLGEGNTEGAEKIMTNSFFMLSCAGVVLTVVILIFAEPLLYMFGATEANFVYAYQYLSFYSIGTIFVMFSIGMNVFITAQGFTKRAMQSVLIGAILNIILDPIFIFGFGLVTRGAAIATVIAQFCSACYVLSFLFGGKGLIKLKLKGFVPSKKIMGASLALGIAPFIAQGTEAAVQIVFNLQMNRYGGSNVDYLIATIGICLSLMQFVTIPISAFAQGSAPLISYNFGSGRMDRVKEAVKFMVIITSSVGFLLGLVLVLFPGLFVQIFNSDPEVLAFGVKYLPIYFGGLCFMGVQLGFQNTFMALGKAKISLFLAMVRKILLLIPLLLIFPIFMGYEGVFYAELVSDILAISTTVVMFAVMFKKILAERTALLEGKGSENQAKEA